MPSPSSGEPVSLAYLLPRSTEDLIRRRQMIEFLMRRCGGALGRLPEYMATILMGLYNARDALATAGPAYAERVAAYFDLCREQYAVDSFGGRQLLFESTTRAPSG